jgi:hypothetical protein
MRPRPEFNEIGVLAIDTDPFRFYRLIASSTGSPDALDSDDDEHVRRARQRLLAADE